MAETRVTQSLASALGLSDKQAVGFTRAGIETLAQAWFHLPLRYENRTQLTPVCNFRDGEFAQFVAQVLQVEVVQKRGRFLVVTLCDEQGTLCRLRYFRFYLNQQRQFILGRRGLFYGRTIDSGYGFEVHHPDIRWLDSDEQPKLDERLNAVYPTVKGVSQAQWRMMIDKALAMAESLLPMNDALTTEGLPSLPTALRVIHQPDTTVDIQALLQREHPACQRLVLEELCAHQISVQQVRRQLRTRIAPRLSCQAAVVVDFLKQLPFTLTAAQQRVCTEIAADLARSEPMLRLVQGDVGSGKTLVALIACLTCIAAGYQAVLMAPTELLAEQHANSVRQLLGTLPVSSAILTSKLPAAQKRSVLAAIADGSAQMIIGTHALFQQQVVYQRLGLVVIDEQHRFGVQQRLALQEKAGDAQGVHQLVLTATPIPRTLAMSQYGELDVSIIDTLPVGRKPIETVVVSHAKRQMVIERVGAVCRSGRQAYWVCPLIEESEVIECENAETTAAQLQQALPDIAVALLHGRMNTIERQAIMAEFVAGKIQLLVATTVIEVGVDVANATLMIIENAERFGLAQLHQLRGRVGRSDLQSYCLLMYQPPLGSIAKSRLNMMRCSGDGFAIAEEDLRLRGAGELLGKRQTGEALLKIADLQRNAALLPKVDKLCRTWIDHDVAFAEAVTQRWLASNAQYLLA